MLSFSPVIAFFLAGSLASAFPAAVEAQQSFGIPINSFRAPGGNVPPPAPTSDRPVISPEMRGDIYMARKMYREAIDMYRQGPPNSPVLINKIGIAFHQMLLLDLAKKNYEQSIKLDHT